MINCPLQILKFHLITYIFLGYAMWSYVLVFLDNRVIDLLAGWRNWFSKHSSAVWNLAPLCLMWICGASGITELLNMWKFWECS